MLGGNVVDQLLDEHRLAHACAAEQADLAALGIGRQKVDDFDAGLKHIHHRPLVLKGGGLPVDGPGLAGPDRPLLIDGLSQDVEHPAQYALAHGNGDGRSGGRDLHAPAQALAGREHDAAHGISPHMLGHFHHLAFSSQLYLQGFLELRERAVRKGHIHHRSHDLYDGSFVLTHDIASPFGRFLSDSACAAVRRNCGLK